jgi:undecaprenyl-diphosphatase
MQYFWKYITYLGGGLGIVVLMVPIFFFPMDQGITLYQEAGVSFMFMFWLLSISLLLARSAGAITKLCFFRDRPLPMQSDTFWKRINAGTFPSLHTIIVTITSMTVFWGVVFLGFPHYLFLVYIMIALAVGLSRIELKKHYPTDVLFGAMYGVLASCITLYGILPLVSARFTFMNLYGF